MLAALRGLRRYGIQGLLHDPGRAEGASAKEIKQAFRKLARKFHPDVNPGNKTAETKFKELNEAHEVLGDPETRKKYDELGANWRMYEQAGAGGPQPGAGWNVARAAGPRCRRRLSDDDARKRWRACLATPIHSPTSSTRSSAAALQAQRLVVAPAARTRARKGRDVEHEIELSLEDAFHGATRRLALQHEGQARTVDVRIPPGVTDGSRVRVAGEGEQGAGGAPGGDLYLSVRLSPHPVFERKGRDLYVKVPVPVPTAVLGGEAEVRTMTGKPARLRIPPLTQNGQVFRLKGYGMPTTGKSDESGDSVCHG